jgi:hypothetical protein
VPRQAPLSLYLLSDGEEPVAYARAVAPARNRRQAAAAIKRLRDGAFAAAGLDYPTELAAWLAPEIGLALFDLPDGDAGAASGSGNWLLALRSRDADGARQFVQRFWQTRSLAGTDLQVSRYRGMGLISGRGALLGRQPLPLATALVDDDLLLIASGRGVLEQALDVSQIDELNQGADPALRQRIADLGEGAALLVARAAGLPEGLGISADPGPAVQVLASLRPDGASLWLEALVERPAAGSVAAGALDATSLAVRRALVAAAPAATERLGLLQNPAALLSDPLLRPLVERVAALAPGAGPLPPLLVAVADGPLVVAEAPAGWLMASAPLELEGRPVTVWTRLVAGRGARPDREGVDRLQAPLEGWRGEQDGQALWGRSLALLEAAGDGRGAQRRERQLEALDRPAAPLQWALATEPARSLLRDWLPWRRLASLAGGPLDAPVRGLAVAVEPGAEGLRLRARLEFGSGR